ncbi:T9SS type A sorting domain-containing protein [Formosa sp. Hel1_31_208]|uniref:T9SS type A sorting domain-containing protein n=1 Tax=Formosa sp. Hel1_31_208 TaxID=1798225 RepID=UPI0012FE0C7A|nr:T9SS type A sorting domain-containing protein [Formosa sp. Hel1_31_208]
MKTKLLLLALLMSSLTWAQVVANQVDDFEDGSTENWQIGGAAGPENMPMNVATDGPAGVDDNFLTYTSLGGAGVASKMVIFNAGPTSQWSSNFSSEGVIAIRMNVRALTNNLNLRVAFQGSGTRICTTNAVTVLAGTGWSEITIPISASDFTLVSGGSTIETALTTVSAMRILSSGAPTWAGADAIAATLHLDNITAATTLGVADVDDQDNKFSISPNPATSMLNIRLSNSLDNPNVSIYDVLGKKVFSKTLSAMTSSIDVSRWNSGVYLVRVSADNQTLTQRFVKQ